MTQKNIYNIELISVEGSNYLGVYKKNEEDGSMIITGGMKADRELDEEFFMEYITKENANELAKNINVEGHAVAAHTQLTDDQIFAFETALRKFEYAAKKAEAQMINDFVKKSL